jgi:hypothetical protein
MNGHSFPVKKALFYLFFIRKNDKKSKKSASGALSKHAF